MSFNYKLYSRNRIEKRYFRSFMRNTGKFRDFYRAFQNGRQYNPVYLQLWALMPTPMREEWNKAALLTGYGGFAYFIDYCQQVSCIRAWFNFPARYGWGLYSYGRYL